MYKLVNLLSFKRFLSIQQNQCFDTILTKASAHLDLFTRINKVEEAIESHKEWLNSITRDLEVTGLSKQLRKLEKVNKVKDGPDKVAGLRWAWGDIVAEHTDLFEWDEKAINGLSQKDAVADRGLIKNKFALRRMTELKKSKHLFSET